MLFLDGRCFLGTIVFITLFFGSLIFSAFIAYRVNLERKSDDPEKRDFAPASPYMAPLTPFIWLGKWIILAPWSLVFGIFLILFPFILIFFRPLPENDPIKKLVLKFGNGILKLNTQFLQLLGLYTKPTQFSA
jgi:hypothetical protein